MNEKKLYQPFYDSNVTPSNKKYSVCVVKNGAKRLIHFGDRSMEHYFDKLGHWKSLNHLDKERRKRYLARAKGIKDSEGNLTWKDRSSPNYYSVKYLW